MRRRAPAPAEDADGVGVVDVEPRAVRLADRNELRQIDDIAAHREDAVHDDEDALVVGHLLEDALELVEIAVDEALHLAEAEPAAVDDARVIVLIGDHDVVPADER